MVSMRDVRKNNTLGPCVYVRTGKFVPTCRRSAALATQRSGVAVSVDPCPMAAPRLWLTVAAHHDEWSGGGWAGVGMVPFGNTYSTTAAAGDASADAAA